MNELRFPSANCWSMERLRAKGTPPHHFHRHLSILHWTISHRKTGAVCAVQNAVIHVSASLFQAVEHIPVFHLAIGDQPGRDFFPKDVVKGTRRNFGNHKVAADFEVLIAAKRGAVNDQLPDGGVEHLGAH